jgi:Domain of unknown function (DUF4333)
MLGQKRASSLIVGCLLVLLLGSCGSHTQTLDTAATERAIAQSILAEHNVRTHVECPREVRREAGVIFRCTARLDVGAYPVLVTETDNGGHVKYENSSPLVVLDIAKVQQAINTSILRQRHLRSTVACPAQVLQQAGIRFTCTATVNGQAYPFDVTEIDADGHVRYLGRR